MVADARGQNATDNHRDLHQGESNGVVGREHQHGVNPGAAARGVIGF